MKPLMLELFSGTARMSAAFRRHGFDTFTVDLDGADWNGDVRELPFEAIPKPVSVVWASPPCTAFSVASIGRNWTDGKPSSEKAREGVELLNETLALIEALEPRYWFIENPRGMMRRVFTLPRRTVTYCRYGETRMKPTDIWTNCDAWIDRGSCRAGDACHERAPRGSRTGTQGIKGARARAALPFELCEEIASTCESIFFGI